jgi:signal transduction histidine kinase
MSKTYELLLIDDDEEDRMVIQHFLKKADMSFNFKECNSGNSGIDAFKNGSYDCVIVDYNLNDTDGIQVLDEIVKLDPHASVILMTGMGDEHLAVTAMKSGAIDYLPKGNLSTNALIKSIRNGTQLQEMAKRAKQAEIELQEANNKLEKKVIERTSELQKAVEAAEKSNQAKSEFLSRMSHELRTPMNAILGFAQLMEKSKKDPLPISQLKRVAQISKAGTHLLELINEILDLPRIETGKMSVSIEPVSISELARDVLSLTRPIAEKYNIKIIDEIESHKNVYVLADKTRLNEVLINLISNAIKYNRNEGTVILSMENKGNEILSLQVTDTGVGISKESLKNIYQPFDRLGNENSNIEGKGIGLTISKKMVDLMLGEINIESTLGEGSRFSVSFPITSPAKINGENKDLIQKKPPHTTKANRLTFLYIEDNPSNTFLVQEILEGFSEVELLTTPHPQTGLDLAQSHQPDLILLDIHLPDFDGFEAFKRLQNMEETYQIPVVALSANAMQKNIDRAINMGFKDYITKPINVKDFTIFIKNFLDSLSDPSAS